MHSVYFLLKRRFCGAPGGTYLYKFAVAALDAPLLTYNQRDFMHAQLKFPSLQIMSPSQWLQ
jgi:hypothetical protein